MGRLNDARTSAAARLPYPLKGSTKIWPRFCAEPIPSAGPLWSDGSCLTKWNDLVLAQRLLPPTRLRFFQHDRLVRFVGIMSAFGVPIPAGHGVSQGVVTRISRFFFLLGFL